ncbi:MAG: 16S rRNA (cytosine(1402)-N(4))-methyltransferase RsmH [Bifidobacteriaceae bacterium]|nr:16S rRNA (cytosine(1402)-N(4))-methyltransferase RsmH [Bifidobacteriaceae bacterium]
MQKYTQESIATVHKPVLLQECIELVTSNLPQNATIVDCTLGLAGHASAFLQAAPTATLIGIDRDPQALELATERVANLGLSERFIPVHAAFDELSSILDDRNISKVHAVFMDLGLSSLQIDEADRGFSYAHNTALDMRMDTTQSLTAQEILDTYSEQDLVRIFRTYGEERFSKPIAKAIIKRRGENPVRTSYELTHLVDGIIPRAHRSTGNPAKRVFQALRIEVNGELDKLARTLPQAALHLAVGGRLVVESYHSLEDKAVKSFMNTGLTIEVPANMPVIPQDAQPFYRNITRGAIKADEQEIANNKRSASVRLRAVELIRDIPKRWQESYKKSA